MKTFFPRETIFLISLILIASFFTALPQVIGLWNGQIVHASDALGYRAIREIILVLIVVYIALWIKKLPRPSFITVSFLSFFIAYSAVLFFMVIQKGYPSIVPISGIRVFQYLPLFYIGFVLGLRNEERYFEKFISFLKFYVLVQLTIGFIEIFKVPPVYGTTFLGSRPFGTLPSPNIFGFTMVTCTLMFYFSKHNNRFWILLSMIGAAVSGSRAAFLGVFIILIFMLARKMSKKSIAVFLPIIPLVTFGVYTLAHTEMISGRNFSGEPRFDVWRDILVNINSVTDLLFGWGLGLGSNTITNLFGYNYFDGQFFSDSVYIFLLSSYGILGLILYIVFLFYTLKKNRNVSTTLFVVFTGFYSGVFLIWETFPSNLLLMFLWGWIIGKAKYRSADANAIIESFHNPKQKVLIEPRAIKL